MNPEIRFRVQEEIYQLAEDRARQIGLSGPDAGKSAGVPLLARAALYQWLGLPWPEDLPKPLLQRPSISLSGAEGVVVKVSHEVDADYRRQQALDEQRPIPRQVQSSLVLDTVPNELKRYLKLDAEGRLFGQLNLPELVSAKEQLTLDELTAHLRRNVRAPKSAQDWRPMLQEWATRHGGELLKARLQEGFEWAELAELEWARWQVQSLVGPDCPLEVLQAQQSLAGPPSVHSVFPDRQPGLDRIRLLQEMRQKMSALPAPMRVSLVKGSVERLESRKRIPGPPFEALLWQIDTPTGNQLGLLSHIQS